MTVGSIKGPENSLDEKPENSSLDQRFRNSSYGKSDLEEALEPARSI
jgi:hypothetical protein